MRKYKKELVTLIKEKEYIETVDTVDILMKPVPDDSRNHVIDPRVYEIINNKMTIFKSDKQRSYRLSSERYRPDKVSYNLCKKDFDVEEKLISVNDTHMINLYLYRQNESKVSTPVMVYLHGGGMISGNEHLYRNQMKLIAELSGALVIFPEYRLAPENPYPAQIEDAYATIEWVYENAKMLNVDVNRFMVAGDSAGGSLTNACILKDSEGIIKRAFEIYPATDWVVPNKQKCYEWSYDLYPVIDEHKEFAYARIDRIKNNMSLDEASSLYIQGKTTFDNPLVSVNSATDSQLRKFPPITIVSAEYDYLRVGSDYFVKRLRSLGISVKSIRYCGCDHGFLDSLGIVAQAEELCEVLAEQLLFVD